MERLIPPFLRLMKGASVRDWLWIQRFDELRKLVYLYLPDLKGCEYPVGDYEIPWPIVFLLGRYNPKHLFMSRAIPKLQPLLDSLREFENKMRWRWYFRNEDSVSPLVRVRRRSVSLFSKGPAAPELEAWLRCFRREAATVCRKATESARYSSRSYCNILPVVKAAMRLMNEHNMIAVSNDKDGGFCCVARTVFQTLRLDMVRSVQYEEVDPLAIDWNSLARSYSTIAKRIALLEEDPSLHGELIKSLHGGKFTAVLQNTVKSHKRVAK